MVLGLNVKCLIRKISEDDDDLTGGAMPTGTVVHENIGARIQQQKEEQILVQQGYEINKQFTAIIQPVTLDIDERYELEVTAPTNYYLYNKPMRVVNVRQADFVAADGRNYIILTLTRSHKAHAIQ